MGSGKSKTVTKTETIPAPEPLPSHSAASITPTRAQQARIEGDTQPPVSLLGEDQADNIKKTTNLLG